MYEVTRLTDKPIEIKCGFYILVASLTFGGEFIMRSTGRVNNMNLDLHFRYPFYVDSFTNTYIYRIEYANPEECALLERKYGIGRVGDNQKHIAIRHGKTRSSFVGAEYVNLIKNDLEDYQVHSSCSINLVSAYQDIFPEVQDHQYVVYQSHIIGHLPINLKEGKRENATYFTVFDSLADAYSFCEKIIQEYPLRECHILDHHQKKVDSVYIKKEFESLKEEIETLKRKKEWEKTQKNDKWWKFWK